MCFIDYHKMSIFARFWAKFSPFLAQMNNILNNLHKSERFRASEPSNLVNEAWSKTNLIDTKPPVSLNMDNLDLSDMQSYSLYTYYGVSLNDPGATVRISDIT